MDMKKNKTLLRLALCLGLAVGAVAVSPAAYADSYKYSRVRSAVNDGDRYVTQAKSARNDAERYQRDAERADSYAADAYRRAAAIVESR